MTIGINFFWYALVVAAIFGLLVWLEVRLRRNPRPSHIDKRPEIKID